MSKASAIMICPQVELEKLPPQLVDAARTVLFQCIGGMDAKNDKRWKRLWGRIWRAAPGEGIQIYSVEGRSGPFHKRHRVILERLFQSQERYRLIEPLHDWLKLKAYFVQWGEGVRGPYPIPRSTNFDECSEVEMREFHNRMVDLLHYPDIQKHLFPRVKSALRQGMVDAVLAPKEGNEP